MSPRPRPRTRSEPAVDPCVAGQALDRHLVAGATLEKEAGCAREVLDHAADDARVVRTEEAILEGQRDRVACVPDDSGERRPVDAVDPATVTVGSVKPSAYWLTTIRPSGSG